MNLIKLFRHAALGLMLIAGVAQAQALAPSTAAKGYVDVKTPQSVQTPGKAEVVEVFWYRCGHCFAFDPTLEDWAKKLPKDVSFRRVPVMWDESRMPDAKLYYALEGLGLLDQLHTKVFSAIHNDGLMVQVPEKLFDWVAAQGIDRKSFVDAYNSFSTMTKVNRARELTRGYGVVGVPSMVVNGKYLITNTSAGGTHDAMLTVADRLISGEKKSSAADSVAPVADKTAQADAVPEKAPAAKAKTKTAKAKAKKKPAAEQQVAASQ